MELIIRDCENGYIIRQGSDPGQRGREWIAETPADLGVQVRNLAEKWETLLTDLTKTKK